MLLLRVHRIEIPVIHDWLFCFIIGIAYAKKVDGITTFLNKYNKYLVLTVFILFFCVLAYLRTYNVIFHLSGIRLDGFLSMSIIVISILAVRNIPYISALFQYLGKHSMNIFMIHTFIFYYFFKTFIYSFHYPIFIFNALLIISLALSILLELIKKEIRLSSLIKSANQKIDSSKL
jgi:membrane-bound acyltransferase YfiQ involved in biofilm formation